MNSKFNSRSLTTGGFRLMITTALMLVLLPTISPKMPILPPTQVAASVTAWPSRDAYTSSQQQNNNFGTAATIRVSNTERAWIRFDLSTLLPPGTTANQVEHATVTLWADTVNAPGSFDVRRIDSPWSQTTITHANAPSLGPAVISGVIVPGRAYITFDITGLVRDWVGNVTPNEGIALVPSSGSGVDARFDSRENTVTSHEPQLQIVLDPAGNIGLPSGAMIL